MEKLYYSISEVSKIVDEEQHILRYWEKEFDEIKPRKNRAGNRVYSTRDLFVIKVVKDLLRGEKLSLKGAKEKIKEIDFLKLESVEESALQNQSAKMTEMNPNFDIKDKDSTFVFDKTELIEIKNLLNDFRKYLII